MQMEANFHTNYTDDIQLQNADLLNYGASSADTLWRWVVSEGILSTHLLE